VVPSELTALLALLREPELRRATVRSRLDELWLAERSLAAAAAALPYTAGLSPAVQAGSARAAANARSRTPAAERDVDAVNRLGLTVLSKRSDRYPPLLCAIPDAPLALFVRGNLDCLQGNAVAIVGSRRASLAGCNFAGVLGAAAGRAGLGVVSGLAAGVDGAAHRGALDVAGSTVAVLGAGHEHVYPARHRGLAQTIVSSGGALVSEYPPTLPPAKHQFPERNRIISGLALGVVVIEASARSGALITAAFAAEQGRDVMAAPGPAGAPSYAGSHRLLRDGARLIDGPADLYDAFGLDMEPATDNIAPMLTPAEARVFACIGHEPVAAAELLANAALAPAELQQTLTLLELKGMIAATLHGYLRT
jgi:DNA processing protein